MGSEPRFVSEAIVPLPGSFGAAAMARGEPGLPPGFTWRGREVRVAEVLEAGKRTGEDRGDVYVRRHTWRLRMEDGAVWSVYFLRQPPKSRSSAGRARRWYLRSIDR